MQIQGFTNWKRTRNVFSLSTQTFFGFNILQFRLLWVSAQETYTPFLQLLWDWQAEHHQVWFSGFQEVSWAPSVQANGWWDNKFTDWFFSCSGGCDMQKGRGIKYCFLTLFLSTPWLSARWLWHLGSKTFLSEVFCKLPSFNVQFK